jgi:hypothetical protein
MMAWSSIPLSDSNAMKTPERETDAVGSLYAAVQPKGMNAAARCMAVYQQGLLALHKVRQNGQQCITVQYVSVSNGSQAVIGNIGRDGRADV